MKALSTTPCTPPLQTQSKTVEAIGLGEKGTYMAALTFGNVHGVYKPGNVHLRPELLKEIQTEVGAKYGKGDKPFYLVFHGGPAPPSRRLQTQCPTVLSR